MEIIEPGKTKIEPLADPVKNPVGRPKKLERAQMAQFQISVRVTRDQYRMIKFKATSEAISISESLRRILNTSLRKTQ